MRDVRLAAEREIQTLNSVAELFRRVFLVSTSSRNVTTALGMRV